MTIVVPWLDADPEAPFPAPADALLDPDGLLAAGGDLSTTRLLNAYRQGIFPWFSDGQPILWWSPDSRMVVRTDGVHLARRFRRGLRRSAWIAVADTRFEQIIDACAQLPRRGQRGTWITPDMRKAYGELHRLGHAHSVEVLEHAGGDARLVGGIYGVVIGRMFFGESMFSAMPGGSKVALAALAVRLHDWGLPLIDAQVESEHLASLGAQPWPRTRFQASVAELTAAPEPAGPWTDRFGRLPASLLAV